VRRGGDLRYSVRAEPVERLVDRAAELPEPVGAIEDPGPRKRLVGREAAVAVIPANAQQRREG